jgi:hypothetical protein
MASYAELRSCSLGADAVVVCSFPFSALNADLCSAYIYVYICVCVILRPAVSRSSFYTYAPKCLRNLNAHDCDDRSVCVVFSRLLHHMTVASVFVFSFIFRILMFVLNFPSFFIFSQPYLARYVTHCNGA